MEKPAPPPPAPPGPDARPAPPPAPPTAPLPALPAPGPLPWPTAYDLPPDALGWQKKAAAFAHDVLAPRARSSDREGRLDREMIVRMGEAGLIRAALPADAGGLGATHLCAAVIAEELGAVDSSARGFLAVQGGLVAATLATFGTPAQKERWLPDLLTGRAIGAFALTEPEAGSDAASIKTRVRKDGADWILEGEKIWITNGGVADVVLVFATVEPGTRSKGIQCWIVPGTARGLRREQMAGRELGHRASDHAQLRFDKVRLHADQRLGPERGGFKAAMHGLLHGRLHVAAGAVGLHRTCLETCVTYARTRRQFGQRIGDFQQVGGTLAEMFVALEASRLLTHHAARLLDRGLDATAAVSAAKLHATESALRAATQAIQVHGSRAYTDALPLERFYRDIVALTIYEGTSNIQRVMLTRHLLGKDESGRA